MKLYCRIKVNGKWTFRAACLNYEHAPNGTHVQCDCHTIYKDVSE